MKTKTNADTTLYCLSPEELLQTAKEIVEEVRLQYCSVIIRIGDIIFFWRVLELSVFRLLLILLKVQLLLFGEQRLIHR